MENEQEDEEEEQETANAKKKKKMMMMNNKSNNRRFSEEQIKQLEGIFEAETKIEPRRKVEVAAELGLQPRQVAIWFQNKRARWKYKRIEMDYMSLRHDYDDLVARFEGLKKERLSLLCQLNNLNDLMEKPSTKRSKSPAGEDETRIVSRIENTEENKEENYMNRVKEAAEWKLDEEVKMVRGKENVSFVLTEEEKDLSDLDLDSDSDKLFDDKHQSCSSISRWLDFWS